MLFEYAAYEPILAIAQLILFMLAMGLTLRLSDFAAVFKNPIPFLSALIGQIFVLPFLAVAINHLFDLERGIAVGLVLVAAMPGGGLSKIFTYFGKGNVPMAISLSAITTAASLATVPLTFQLLARDHVAADFEMPVADVVTDVTLFLLSPLVIGMILGPWLGEKRKTLARWSMRLGFVAVFLMVAGAILSQRIRAGQHGWLVPLAIILFCVLGQQLNQVPFYLKRWPRPDRLAAAIEVTMRNMNLALTLKALLFQPDELVGQEVLFVILFYAAAALGAGALLCLNHRRLARRSIS